MFRIKASDDEQMRLDKARVNVSLYLQSRPSIVELARAKFGDPDKVRVGVRFVMDSAEMIVVEPSISFSSEPQDWFFRKIIGDDLSDERYRLSDSEIKKLLVETT